MFIYKTTNLVNGKIYIGQHIGDRPYYIGSGKSLKAAIKKYGRENFKREILEYCDNVDHMNEREIIWIARYDSTNPLIGYNLEYGGNGKGKVNEETKKKISETKKGEKNFFYGKKHSEESRKKISEANKKRGPLSEETRKKMSEAAKGKKFSEESIRKRSEARKIKIIQLTLDGLKVKIWDGARDADKFGFHHSSITACCKGRIKTHKGFIWMYLHDYEKGLNND
jgi:group I intron endonuclease